MEKCDFLVRLQKLRAIAGTWDTVAELMESSRAQVLRMSKVDYPLNEKHVLKLKNAEKKVGISESPTENILRKALTDRMAHFYNHTGHDADIFLQQTGILLEDSNFIAGNKSLPSTEEMLRLAQLGSENMNEVIAEAEAAISEIQNAQEVIKNAQDKLRSMVYFTSQRAAAGQLDSDPLIQLIGAYASEQSL